MKKTLLLVTALTASLATLAQNPIVPVEFQARFLDRYIPKAFADAPYLVQYDRDAGDAGAFKVYNHNLQLVSSIPWNGSMTGTNRVYNYDEEFLYQSGGLLLTQTLFNNDSRFEYISQIEDGEGNCVRFDVVADDGTVVNTFGDYAGMGCRDMWIDLYKIANIVYLRVNAECSSVDDEWYRIDRQTQSISRVEGMPFNVFPTVADRESTITVQFEDGATATELQVLDAQGRTVQRIPVAPGQQEVKVSTRGLRSGVGFIGDRRGGAAKIIVR